MMDNFLYGVNTVDTSVFERGMRLFLEMEGG